MIPNITVYEIGDQPVLFVALIDMVDLVLGEEEKR